MKKIITLIMAFLVCAAMAVPAFASTADTTITGFSVNVYSYHHLTPRTKDDSSAVYFYYRDGKRDHIRARALGGSAQNGSMNNCTVSGGTRVNYVTCHNGNKYSIHSFINEDGYRWATLSFSCPNLFGETMSGEWSPDSANSYKDATP